MENLWATIARGYSLALRSAAVFAVLGGTLSAGAANVNFTALRQGTGVEDYIFTAGDRVVPTAQLDNNVWFKVTVRNSAGVVLNPSFPCTPSSAFATNDNSYVIQPTDTPSTATPYTFTIEEFTNSVCGGTAVASASKQFYVAGATGSTCCGAAT